MYKRAASETEKTDDLDLDSRNEKHNSMCEKLSCPLKRQPVEEGKAPLSFVFLPCLTDSHLEDIY